MEEKIQFYNGNSAQPTEVRVLLFNDTVNIYDINNDNLIHSFPVKGSVINVVGTNTYIYEPEQSAYLRFITGDNTANQLTQEIRNSEKSIFSRLLRHKAITLITATIMLAVGVYFLLITSIPAVGSRLITKDAEISIGRNLKELMLQQEGIAGSTVDSARTAKMKAFVSKLTLSKKYPINVTVIKNKTVNAYALPGGEIVVYTGILEKMTSYEPLVALLAHESTHVNERHTLKSLLRSAANGLLISIIFGDATGISGALASNVENLNGLRYSRSLETEADTKGMELMIMNKVSIEGMQELMKILNEEKQAPEALEFLSTHPLTTQRIKNANKFIKEHKALVGNHDDLKMLFEQLK